MNTSYPYGWSINASINPKHWLMIVVWIGNRNWRWDLRHPFRLHRRSGANG